jgi:hypothetical protein
MKKKGIGPQGLGILGNNGYHIGSPAKNLNQWFKEDWRTPGGNKDYSEGENTFRPTKRISKDTPATWDELTPAEKANAQKEKNTQGRVSKYKK